MKANKNFPIENPGNYKIDSLQEQAEKMKNKDDAALMKACKEFEAIFVQMMFKEMYKTIPEDGIIEKDSGSKIFEEMYIEEISKEIVEGDQGFGLADMMYEQFKKGYVAW